MNKTRYAQADSRWGRLPYKSGQYQMHNCGCGCVAVTHVCIQSEKYWNNTPKKFHKYMRQFAENGHGTLWSGIPKSLKHFGMKNVQQVTSDAQLLRALSKGKKAVVLMNSHRGRDGKVWTSGGHFIAIVGYNEDGHKCYVLDSGQRNRTGWYDFENSLDGCINYNCVWVCDIPDEPKRELYKGEFPNIHPTLKKGAKGIEVERLQLFLKWCGYDVSPTARFGNKTRKAVKDFQASVGIKATGRFGSKSLEKAKAVKR